MALGILRGVLATCILCTLAFCSSHGSPTLLIGTDKDIRLTNLTRGNKHTSIIKSSFQSSVLDYYLEKNLVCWTDPKLEVIECRKTNNNNNTESFESIIIVNSTFTQPVGLACDWYTSKIYWTDAEKNRIEVTSIDGDKYRKVLFWSDISQPRAIALAPIESYLFWTDWGSNPKIERASMNGDPTTRKIIVKTNVHWPNSLAIDYDHKSIYWLDTKIKTINVVDYDGNNRKTIVKDIQSFAITFMDNKLYWSDSKYSSIYLMDMSSSQLHSRELIHGDYVPNDIKIWDYKKQQYSDNPCRHNNGNCSHLCLLSTYTPGYSCACPTGIKLINNNTCANKSEEFILVVQKHKIGKVSLETDDYTNFVLPFNGIKHAIAIDFDIVDEMVYWTDERAHAIRRAYLNGTGQQDIVNMEVINPDGIAIDLIARNLYWTDTGTNRIEVSRLDGSSRKVIISEDLWEPRAIALAPELGWMFWTDWDKKHPKIERSNLDGSERILLITKDVVWPNGLALDHDNKKLYWCDAKMDKIEVCNMDGTERREVITDDLPHLFGLSLLGEYLYWTDWQQRSINRAHKASGSNRITLVDQAPDVMGLKAVRLGPVKGTNPCANKNGGCSHLCLNKPGNNFVCACKIGQELTKDKKTCIIPDAFLLFSRKDAIGRLSIENANNDNIIPITGIKDASALDFDMVKDQIYWTDVKAKTISRAFINGSDIEKIVDLGLEAPEGLAIDWISHNLYWSDSTTRRIEVMRLENKSRKVLIWQDLIEPGCLALDPVRGHVYWSEKGKSGSIERAALDGSLRKTIISNIGKTRGLTMDHFAKKLYWADLYAPAIDSFDLKTMKRKTVITQDIFYPFSITQYLDFIYWTDWNTGFVERADKLTGYNRTKIHNKLESVTGILAFHESRQAGTNPCANDNGGCTQICLALPDNAGNQSQTYKCACSTHYILDSDNKTCLAPKNFMVYSTRNSVARFLPDMNDCPDVLLRVQGLKNVRSIEFDPVTQSVYWIDGRTMTIRKAMENKTQGVVVRSGNNGFHPFDIAIDPLGRLLFLSCAEHDTINVTNLDNRLDLGVVVQGDITKPRHIAVHPERRLLFWTDIGNSTVMQSLLDGKEKIIIAYGMEQLTALAIDTVKNKIFWANNKKIESSDIGGGNNYQTLVTIDEQGAVVYMAVLNDYLYWFNRDKQIVERIIKTNGENRKTIINRGLTDLITVRTPIDEVIETHACSPLRSHGNCSHFCLGTFTEATCSCPQYLVLSDDNKTCRAKPVCGADHFTCADISIATAKDCIPGTWKCDGHQDCPDNSDELGCPTCSHDQFRCQSGECIDKFKICDGIPQCFDHSDEARCCQKDQFRCKTQNPILCIPDDKLCDGFENCADKSDESNDYCLLKHQEDQQRNELYNDNSTKPSYIIFILIIFFIIMLIILTCCYCCRGKDISEELPDILHDSAGDPLQKTGRLGKPVLTHNKNNNNKNLKTSFKNIRMSTLSRSSIGSSYDRSHITGASSSTRGSTGSSYPHETLNPPPSPATTANSTRCSSSNTSRCYRPYKNYKTINQPPPPTPCSTDVCDESDSNYHPSRYRYESEPFPPPPTPRSIYHSDAAISCPPSPSSRSSTYFNPFPPPPSPAQ